MGVGLSIAAHRAPAPRGDEYLRTAVLVGVAGAGAAIQVAVFWARARSAHAAPVPALAAALALALLARVLPLARGGLRATLGTEISLIGLLLALGLAVAFVPLGPGAPPALVLTVASVWAVWWHAGQLGAGVLAGTDPDDRRTEEELNGAAHGIVFGGIAVAAALALVGPTAFPRPLALGRPASVVAMAAQCAAGCLLVAGVHRRALLRRAAAVGAVVVPGFRPGSAGGLLGATLALIAVGTLLPAFPPILSPRSLAVLPDAFDRFLVHGAPASSPGGVAPIAGRPAGAGLPNPGAGRGGGGAVLGVDAFGILLGVAVLALFAYGLVSLIRTPRRRRGRRSFWAFLLDLWASLRDLLAALFAALGLPGLWRLLTARPAGRDDGGEAGEAAAPPLPVWSRIGDPRRRIRASYRHLLAGADRQGHRRPGWFTPRAFRRQLTAAVGRGDELERLTALYEEARYSPHPLDRDHAGMAEAAAETVVRGLGRTTGGRPSDNLQS